MTVKALKGRCQCGHIRYRLEEPVHRLNVCHCLDCQRQSGSAFGMSLVIQPDSFCLTSGTLKFFELRAASGRDKQCAFCPECAVRIYNATSALMSIKAGTLDEPYALDPDAHYWVKRKLPWVPLPDGTPCFEEIG
ncbi:MAG: aldehyde-activating protein [Pseudomonadales bacterium]|nr:aldehyde-activating protein [Pseudomonadales bacterium]